VKGTSDEDTIHAEFFDATDEERIGKELVKDLNDKILTVKNSF